MSELGLALALMLVIEGAVYALFPDLMKRLIQVVEEQPTSAVRWTGVAVAALGVGLMWLIRGG